MRSSGVARAALMKCRIAPAVSCRLQPDPAELVHRAAVRRVQRQGLFLVLAGARARSPRARLTLPDRKCTSGSFGASARARDAASAAMSEALRGQRGLRHAHVRLPVAGRQAARLVRRPQRVRVVAPVDQGVAGQPVRPLVGRVEGRRPVGGADRLGVAFRAQVRAGHQAPGPAALRLGRDHPGQQRRGLVEAPDVEHRGGPRQLLRVSSITGRSPGAQISRRLRR